MSKYSTEIVELLCEQLSVHEQNLTKLELQAARHGMDVPLALQNQIDFEIQKIEELRKRLAKAEARPSAAEEAAAVPLWQNVPVWAWAALGGVVLLIAVALAFLAGRGAKPEPMSTVVARVATPTATSAAMPQPTATPLVPTFTPLPPTDTPVPPTATPVLPTDTPVPTSTPRPTATPVPPTNTPVPTATPQPTPTMDADPTVYDNFNNPANEGGYNTDLWELWHLTGRVAQQDGVLMFTQQGKPEDGTYLGARKYYDVSLDSPTFFEARLMLSPEANAGFVRLASYTKLSANEDWNALCRIKNQDGEAQAGCSTGPYPYQEERHYASYIPVQFGSWHAVRMGVDPATMTFSCFVDGQLIGSHVPVDADKLKKVNLTPNLGIWTETADAITGYVDEVRVGLVQ